MHRPEGKLHSYIFLEEIGRNKGTFYHVTYIAESRPRNWGRRTRLFRLRATFMGELTRETNMLSYATPGRRIALFKLSGMKKLLWEASVLGSTYVSKFSSETVDFSFGWGIGTVNCHKWAGVAILQAVALRGLPL